MKLLKNILCGVLIATAVSTLSAMDMHGVKPIIDCYEINTKEALVNALKHHGYIEAGFTVDNVWQGIPECVNDVWKRLDEPSKKSILDAHKRLSTSVGVLKEELAKKFATPEPPQPTNLSYTTQLHSWVIANKGKTLGIGIVTLATIDVLQAYCRTDKATWKESDLKGKLELVRRKMLITRSYNGARGFITSRCA